MNQTHLYPPQYRKLGGWLMFINVITILSIVRNGLSLLTNLVSFSQAVNGWYSNNARLQSYYVGTAARGMITAAVFLALSICVLIFLHRRRLKPFRIFFIIMQGLYVVEYVLSFVTSIINPVGQSLYNTYGTLFEEMFDVNPYSDGLSSHDIQALFQGVEVLYWIFLIIGMVVAIGLFITWLFYLLRSKRVKVYFDPAYVDPPGWQDGQPIISPAAYYGAYAQPYGAAYPSAQPGYPAPYGAAHLHHLPPPPQAPVYPQAPPAGTPAQAPLPHQEPPAQQQARQAGPPT